YRTSRGGIEGVRAAIKRCGSQRYAGPLSADVRLYSLGRGLHRMGMPALDKEWTAEMVRAIPDDNNRYQVVDVELFVTPSPTWRHGDVLLEFCAILLDYLKQNPIGHLKISPQDVELDYRTLVEPDLFVVPLVDGK